jgi:hypothetical protein
MRARCPPQPSRRLGQPLPCGGRREPSLPSWPTSSTPFPHSNDGMCHHPTLPGPAPPSAPLLVACVSQKRALKHSWPAPGLSGSALNGVQLACLDRPRPRLFTASLHLVLRLIAFEHGRLGAQPPPVDCKSIGADWQQQLWARSAARLRPQSAAVVSPLGRPLSTALGMLNVRISWVRWVRSYACRVAVLRLCV